MSRQERGGVPWNKIFYNLEKGRPTGSVIGESGYRLRYRVAEWDGGVEFAVYDIDDSKVHLKANASLDENSFGLNLRTRGFQRDPAARHPDLHAREFVGEALEIFREQYGFVPSSFVARWLNIPGLKSNFDVFWSNYLRQTDKVYAARQTWTAKAIDPYGFTKIQETDIVIDDRKGNINATFWRRWI